MEKKMVTIENDNGTKQEVELVTYLISDDKKDNYIVYSKGETSGDEGDEVVYISKIIKDNDTLTIEEITEDQEWTNVQSLLKKIANS